MNVITDYFIAFLKKNRSLLLYGIFGVLTTVVNFLVYYLLAHLLGVNITLSTAAAWAAAVLFAYLTNRKWVFSSSASGAGEIGRELLSFVLCRVGTGLLDLAIMFVFADMLSFHDLVVKICSNILVIILNYVASKLVIFK